MNSVLRAFPQRGPLGVVAALTVLTLLISIPAMAGGDKAASLDYWNMAMKLFGGLAIFLYGMEIMTQALREVAGDKMKNILAKMTTNRFAGVATGAVTTAVVQSSSVTTVIVVGFVTAGLMNLHQAIGVIFGANIGTTITAQIVAFKVTKYALLMIAAGFFMWIASKNDKTKQWGLMLLGLGLVFFGMKVMGGAMKPLRSLPAFHELMQNMATPIYGIGVAAVFTGLIQSSSATTSIVIVMASQGLVTLEAGIALAFGANIGTCVTALLACIGKTREAIRAAVVHLLFNILGVLIWIAFIDDLASMVRALSPVAEVGLSGTEKIAAETPRQIANAHTIFNTANTFIFIFFVKQLADLVLKLVPDRALSDSEEEREEARAQYRPKYLDTNLLSTTSLALSMSWRETQRMSWAIREMLAGIPVSVFKANAAEMSTIRDMDARVDALYREIARYLTMISRNKITSKHANEAMMAMATITELENIGNIVRINFNHLSEKSSELQDYLTEEHHALLNDYHEKLMKSFQAAMSAFEHDRQDLAELVINMEEEMVLGIDKMVEELRANLLQLEKTDVHAYDVFVFQNGVLENMKRTYLHIRRIAKMVAQRESTTALIEYSAPNQ
ncbi:Na/Pi cotransporter family protein [Magnetococcales bacterium HHB-1]